MFYGPHHSYAREGFIESWFGEGNKRTTIPLGGGVGRLPRIDKQAINVRTEAYYNIEKPDSAPDWQWGFTVQFLFSKKN